MKTLKEQAEEVVDPADIFAVMLHKFAVKALLQGIDEPILECNPLNLDQLGGVWIATTKTSRAWAIADQ